MRSQMVHAVLLPMMPQVTRPAAWAEDGTINTAKKADKVIVNNASMIQAEENAW